MMQNQFFLFILLLAISLKSYTQNLDIFYKFNPPLKDSSVVEQSGSHIMTRYSKTVGNLLFFRGVSSANPDYFDIFRTDGTSEGTFPVTTFLQNNNTFVLFSESRNWASLNDVLFFSTTNYGASTRYFSLWRTDGTPGRTYEILFPDEPASAYILGALFASTTHVFFTLYNDIDKTFFLYSIDIAGVLKKCGQLMGTLSSRSTIVLDDKLVIFADTEPSSTPQTKLGMFVSDGTIGSLTLKKEFNETGYDFDCSGFTNVNNEYGLVYMYKFKGNDRVFYLAKVSIPTFNVDTFYRLGSYGTEGLNGIPSDFVKNEYGNSFIGNKYIFQGGNGLGVYGIWATDGSRDGTYLIKKSESVNTPFEFLFNVNNKYVFSELTKNAYVAFSTDGAPLSFDTLPLPFRYSNWYRWNKFTYTYKNKVYISTDDKIWQSDGTSANTFPLFSLPPLTSWQIDYSHYFDIAGDNIYFPLVLLPRSVNRSYHYAKLGLNFTAWTGNESTNFMDPKNWDAGLIPNQNTSILIPDGRKFYPFINQDFKLRKIVVSKGASVSITNGSNLQIE